MLLYTSTFHHVLVGLQSVTILMLCSCLADVNADFVTKALSAGRKLCLVAVHFHLLD